MKTATVAIVTRDYDKYSETFVRRHVDELFGGRTVIIAFEPSNAPPRDKPFHVFDKKVKLQQRWWHKCTNKPGQEIIRRDREIVSFLNRTGVTHVLCEFGYVATEVAEVIARSGLPVYCYFRGNDASKCLHDPNYVAALRRLFAGLAGVIAVSQYLLERLSQYGLLHANTIVIPSGTDVDLIRPGETEEAHIITVGRLVEKKDPLTAMKAFARISQGHPKLTWIIAGSGPLAKKLARMRDLLGLHDRIAITGVMHHSKVIDLMTHATAYFQAFRIAPDGDSEGMPSVIQEAMAAGRAIVTTRHAGIPEHVEHGLSGLLFDEGDEVGLAEGLNRVLSSPELRLQLGTAARAHALKHLDYRLLYQKLESFLLQPRNSTWSD